MSLVWFPHLRMSFGGHLGTPGVDNWSNTVRFVSQGLIDDGDLDAAPSRDELEDAVEALWTPLSIWFNNANSSIANCAHLDWVKLNLIKPDGKQRDVNTVLKDDATVAGGSGQSVPWYQTVALTHRTALARGRAHAGRIYPPAVTAPVETQTPYISANQANGMAKSWANSLFDIMAAIVSPGALGNGRTDWKPAVLAAGNTAPPTGPATSPLWQAITAVVADRVPDVQHRRTRQVPRSEGNPQAFAPA